MIVLLTGATGFIGSTLVPRLAADGHEVRALSRDRSRLATTTAEAFSGDVLTGAGLADALRGVEVAYYLVHSMERPRNAGKMERPRNAGKMERPRNAGNGLGSASFEQRDRQGALRFGQAARAAGVRRIVYLGGPMPRTPRASAHLRSRLDIERILLQAVPDSLALRASIVIGAGSRSFRLLVRLVERLPVLAMPAWRVHRTRPIDARDAIELLLAAASAEQVGGRSLEAGGPETLSYEQILASIAEAMLVSRPRIPLRLSVTPLAGRLTAAIVKEDPDLVVPLMESLAGDLLLDGQDAGQALAVPLHSFDAAVEHALAEWEAVEPLAAR